MEMSRALASKAVFSSEKYSDGFHLFTRITKRTRRTTGKPLSFGFGSPEL